MILLPDENIPDVYKNDVEPNMKKGATLAFAHGFNVHYNQVVPREDLDVIMVAPKGPGHTVRSEYLKGGGVPSLIAVYQDKSGKAKDIALSYAAPTAAPRAASSKPTSAKKPKPTCSASRLCCAVAPSNWSRWASKP
jgi:ketol-acid reductoisomerase